MKTPKSNHDADKGAEIEDAAPEAPPVAKVSSQNKIIALAVGGAVLLAASGALGFVIWSGQTAQALAMPGVGEQVPRLSLATGMCPNGVPERPIADYDTLPVVDCDEPHLEEIFANQALTGLDEWDPEEIRAVAERECAAQFEVRTGQPADESLLAYTYYLPSASDWEAGYRSVACALYDPRGPMTGLAPVTAAAEEEETPGDVAEEESVEEAEGQMAPAPAKPTPAPRVPSNQQQIDDLLNTIEGYNNQIDFLSQEKRALIDEYERTYGPYSPDGPLYLNGDPNAEIDLKQQIDDLETGIRNLEADVAYFLGQLRALQNP